MFNIKYHTVNDIIKVYEKEDGFKQKKKSVEIYYINDFKQILLTISRNMSKENQLSKFEKGQIHILKRQGLNLCENLE